jgi:hypothetical protein
MQKSDDYLDFKLALVEKTYDLYIKRMDIWEDQFYKIKYGCISVVIALLGFRYSLLLTSPILNYLAIAATIGLWFFESALRTTFFRYIAKLDLITEIINNKKIMENALQSRDLNALRVLDFDIRTKTLHSTISEYIKVSQPELGEEQQKELIEKMFSQKQKIISLWSSFMLKNNTAFYGTLLILQIIALIFFRA